jgi:hypothetical protein
MATYNEVIEALRNADAAGNADDARRLAEIAQSMRTNAAPTPAEEIPPPLQIIGDEPTPPTMGDVVKEAIGRTVTRIPAAISAAGTYYGTLGESEFPSQLPPQGATEQAMDRFSRGLGLRPELRPATEGQKYAMAAAEGIFDPLNLFGLGGVKTGLGLLSKGIFSREGARVGLQLGAGGTAGVGGEFGGEVGGQIAGSTGQIIGGIGTAILLGGGTLTAGQKLFDKAQFDPKDFDIADMANVEGISKAQDLVKQAIDADPNLQAKLKTVQDRVLFVTGKQGAAAVTGIDNITLKGKLEQLARDDLAFATEVKQLYADLKTAVNKKANELYPAPSAEIPSAKTKIAEQEVDYNKRIGFIDNQIDKITANLDITGATKPSEIGTSIQNLVLTKEKAARASLSPEYDSVLSQASNQGALLPAQDTQQLLNTAFDLFNKDPWGRNSDLLRLLNQQSLKFKALRKQTTPTEAGATLPATTAPDLSVGLDITSLDSLKRRVASDVRTMKDPAVKAKLILLQQRVDEALDKVQNASGDIQVDFRGEKIPFGQAVTNLDTDYFNKVGIPFRDAEAIKKISSLDYSEKIAPLIATSPTAMTQFLRVAGDEGTGLAEKAVMSKMYNQALDKNGYVDPAKLQSLLSKTSNNGGYSDVIDQLPALKQRLDNAAIKSQYLASEKVAIDDAAKETRKNLGESFLSNYDEGGVKSIVSKMTSPTGIGYRNKFFVDLKKLSSEEQTNVKLAVKNGLVNKMLSTNDPFDYLQKNQEAFTQVFGKEHFNNLVALSDVARLSNKIDIDDVVKGVAAKETSELEKQVLGGVSLQRISGILVNQIASTFNKAFRITSLIGQANIDQATKDAHRTLFLDENGVKKIIEASSKIISKKGKEVNLKDTIKSLDLSDVGEAIGLATLRSGYLGATSTFSRTEVVEPQTEPFYEYTPTE